MGESKTNSFKPDSAIFHVVSFKFFSSALDEKFFVESIELPYISSERFEFTLTPV